MIFLLFGINLRFKGNLFAGLFAGVKDSANEMFSDTDVSTAVYLREMLDDCKPWSQHLTEDGIKQLNKAISKGKPDLAKQAINKHLSETSAPWCIKALKVAVVIVCDKCPSILYDAIPTSYY